ncbi:MAG: PQQ-binding-like beta-propeller repeat protein [Verrucomicrobiales bacterium]|nr:PQQ-binding-like beta-propeller repeat protein [Verrucomicrobiales bacterium]
MEPIRLTLAIILTFSSWSFSQEWTRFRGPNGTGIGKIKGLPGEISAMDYHWAVKTDGEGHSSPVLWGNKIFITQVNDGTEKGSERKVLCFEATNGNLLWEWTDPLESHNLHKFNNFASSTPTVDQDRVYLVWGSGTHTQAVALSHSGGLVWRKEWPGFTSDHGQGSSPILVDGVLVFHTDSKDDYKSYVIGLNPESGEVVWEVERITPASDKKHFTAYNTPVTVKSGAINTVVALQSNDGWKGINPVDGSIVWQAPGGYSFRSVGSVASANGYLFASFGSGGAGKQGTTLKVGDGDAEVLYSLGIKDGLGYVPSPLIYNGLLFLWADGGVLTCRDLATGEQKFRERIGGNFFSSPVIGDGKIICGSLDGELITVAASDKFQILGRSRLESGMHATPAIANECLYFRTGTHIICVCGKK